MADNKHEESGIPPPKKKQRLIAATQTAIMKTLQKPDCNDFDDVTFIVGNTDIGIEHGILDTCDQRDIL